MPIPHDPRGFHRRLLLAGFRFAPVPVLACLHETPLGPAIVACHESCTGYLFATDGVEASETDLFHFLSAELQDGEGISISGQYVPNPGHLIQSDAHFRKVGDRLLSTEERVLTGPGGLREVLISRSDLLFGNVVPLRPRAPDFGYEP